MHSFRLRLLGPLQVERDGERIEQFRSKKVAALLAYLAVQGEPVSRTALMDSLWPDEPEQVARRNLRWALSHLKSLFPGCFEVTRLNVACRNRLHPAIQFDFDVDTVSALLASQEPASLARAVDLYQGEFMEGFFIDGSTPFETWLSDERQRWCKRITNALQLLIQHHSDLGQSETALEYVRRLLALDPWREEAHRQAMMLYARSGQRSAALTQFQSCCQALKEHLGLEPDRLTVALYQRIVAATNDPPRHRLPAPTTPFLGRQQELQAVVQRLANPTCRLLTITGPGGIGKSRLALEVADRVKQQFLDGVCFVPLAYVEASQPHLLVMAIASALELSLYSQHHPAQQLINFLHQREMLLILDNFEQLLPQVEFINTMLKYAPHLKILVTSRERLNLLGEWLYPLGGLLDGPDDAAQAANVEGAVALFTHSAQRVNAHFVLSQEGRAEVVEICRLVGGMPLAIELAASWARDLSCREIAMEIKRDPDFLAVAHQDLPPRHRSLRALFEHSWARLNQEEREALCRLSIFRGTFSRQAAAEITGTRQFVFSTLVDKSLLRRHDQHRFSMPEMVHAYASEKLAADADELEQMRERHCRHFANFTHAQLRLMEGSELREALAVIRTDIDNIRSGWQYAIQQRFWPALEQYQGALFLFYELQSWLHEGLQAFAQLSHELKMVPVAQSGLRNSISALLAKSLVRQSRFCELVSDYRQALALAEEGLGLARVHVEPAEVALALLQLGGVHRALGHLEAAAACLQEALALFQRLDGQRGLARTHRQLGHLAMTGGEFAQARVHFEQSFALRQKLGDLWGMAVSLNDLGEVATVAATAGRAMPARADGASRYFSDSLSLSRGLGFQQGVVESLTRLAFVSLQRHEYQAARRYVEEALPLARQIGSPHSLASALQVMALLAQEEGHQLEAWRCAREMLLMVQETESVQLAERTVMVVAEVLAGRGLTGPALSLFAFVDQHPAAEQWLRQLARQRMDSLAGELPAEQAASALEKGRRLDLPSLIAAVLGLEVPA